MTKRRKKSQTLRGRFLRVTIPLIFISVISVFSVIELMTHKNAVERLERSIDSLIRTQAEALANPLWNLDREQIRLSLEAIVTNREILFARVLGESEKPMSEVGSIPKDTLSNNLLKRERKIEYDAGAGAKVIGRLEFVATRKYVNEQTRNRLIIAGFIALVAVFIEVAAALYALRTIIGKPLERLLFSIKQARSGKQRQPVDWDSTDELGQVIGAYNEMQDQQETDERALRDARDTLEVRVDERTAELVEARDQSLSTQARLDDAIEAISDGFSLYDANDQLVVSNTRYRELLHADDDSIMQPGADFKTILQTAIDRGFIANVESDKKRWLTERMARHREPGTSHVQQYANGHWIRVSERRTQDGGVVAVYSDITELKQREKQLGEKSAQLEQLSNQLAKYLSPQVYDSIFQGKQEVTIAATRKKLTVFFSDIAGFTETADRLESEELTHLLNHYLTEMSQIALEHGATIDKYVGDAILIFFGDPETRGTREDALSCVRMAVAMQQRMQELATVWRASGIARPLHCRMGIHTDFCTVGNFGSEDRLDYTIIGRGVNIASRLENHCEPDQILISYETFAHILDEFDCLEAGEITVKGLAYPVLAYQVEGNKIEVSDEASAIQDDWSSLSAKHPSKMTNAEKHTAIRILTDAIDKPKPDLTPGAAG